MQQYSTEIDLGSIMSTWSELVDLAHNTNHSEPPRRINQAPKVRSTETPATPAGGSHDDHALRFASMYADRLAYLPERGTWAVWQDYRWSLDNSGQAMEYLREFMRVSTVGATPQVRNSCLSVKYMQSVLSLAKSDPRIVAHLQDFDADVYEINTPAGMVDLHTGAITAPSSKRLVMRSTAVAPDASVATPLWDQFMAETFAGDPDLAEYTMRMLGVSLVLAQDEQVFMYMHGEGGNGKGTLMTICQSIIGLGETGYSITVDSAMLQATGGTAHPTELAQFVGARMAVSSEVDKGAKVAVAKIKKLVGGEFMSGRFMRADFFSFKPTHTLWIMANDRLKAPHSDKGFWRRLRELPFRHTKAEGEYIKGLAERIVDEEGPGVLAKIIDAAGRYLSYGLDIPTSVVEANEAYKDEQDTVAGWLSECTEVSGETFASGARIRGSYLAYCKAEGQDPLGPKQLTQALINSGYPRHRDASLRGHKGLNVVEHIPN